MNYANLLPQYNRGFYTVFFHRYSEKTRKATVLDVGLSCSCCHCRPDPADPGSWPLPTSVRRRHRDLPVLPTLCVTIVTGAPEHHHQLCRWCRQVDSFQQAPTEHYEDRSSFSSAAAVTTSSWHWRSYASLCRSWPRHLHRLRRFDEVTRHEDRLCLLRRITSAAKRPSVRSQIRSPVAGHVTRSDATGSRKCNHRRIPAVAAEADSVGDELCCSAGVFFVKARAHHSTLTSTALVEGGGADRLQAGSSCLQVSARGSTVVPRRWTLPASRHRGSTSSVICLVIVADCPPYAAVNRRRLNFPVAADRVWNGLPHITSAPSLGLAVPLQWLLFTRQSDDNTPKTNCPKILLLTPIWWP